MPYSDLSLGTPGNAPTASMSAAARSHCILCARDLRTLAFVFGLYRWSTNYWCLLVVYYRIGQISRLNAPRPRGTGGSMRVSHHPPEKWGPAALDPAEPARLCASAAVSYRTWRAPRGPGPLGGGLSSSYWHVYKIFASQSLHNKKKLKKIRRCK